jgi:hypothetical protein
MARGGAQIAGRIEDLSLYLRALRAAACVTFILVFLVGCGKSGSTVRVTGQLLKDGKSYGARLSGPEPETFVVDFVGNQNGHQYRFPANITATGSFRVDGAEGRGIPRGQYKINVVHSGFQGAGGDRLNARFAGDNTPLVVELTDNTSLSIDLGAGTVTKS